MTTRQMERNRLQTCEVCGKPFDSVRYNASICSAKCRMRKKRHLDKIEELLNTAMAAIDVLKTYHKKDGHDLAFNAVNRIATRSASVRDYWENIHTEPAQLEIPASAYTITNKVGEQEIIDDLDPDMVAKKFGYDVPHILAYFDARFVTRYGHRWAWGKQTIEKVGTEYYLRPSNVYLGHYMEAIVAMANYVQSGKDNAAARRAWQVKRGKSKAS